VFEPNGWHEYDVNSEECPFCKVGKLVEKIPDYETPARYKARTGKPYPDDGLVFFRHVYEGEADEWKWHTYEIAIGYWADEAYDDIVIADPPVPPPEGWKQEE
jgi:hypothetical protein